MPSRRKTLLLLTCGLLTRASVFAAAPWPSRGIYAGYYSRAFEVSKFQPQGTNDQWWLRAESRSDFEIVAESALNNRVYIVARGSISGTGKYGHLGEYSRELIVTHILEWRQVTPEEAHEF